MNWIYLNTSLKNNKMWNIWKKLKSYQMDISVRKKEQCIGKYCKPKENDMSKIYKCNGDKPANHTLSLHLFNLIHCMKILLLTSPCSEAVTCVSVITISDTLKPKKLTKKITKICNNFFSILRITKLGNLLRAIGCQNSFSFSFFHFPALFWAAKLFFQTLLDPFLCSLHVWVLPRCSHNPKILAILNFLSMWMWNKA